LENDSRGKYNHMLNNFKIQLYYKLCQSRVFWIFKNKLSRLSFLFLSKIFGFKTTYEENVLKTKGFLYLIRTSIKQFLMVLLLALLTLYIERYIAPYICLIGFKIPTDTTYVTLLGTISGIGGVFIALYYTTVCTINSVVYSKSPNNIKELIIHEPLGNTYLNFLVFMTLYCLILIAFYLLGSNKSFLAIVVSIIFAGFSIITFVKLGQRAFYFFDPTKFSPFLIQKLISLYRNVNVNKFRCFDSSFQNHQKKIADNLIDTFIGIAKSSSDDKIINKKSYIDLSKQVCDLLSNYSNNKKNIVYDSKWYKEKYIHKDIYEPDGYSSLDFLVKTGTLPLPKNEINYDWFEDKLIQIIIKNIEFNFINREYDSVLEVLTYLINYFKYLAKNGSTCKAFSILDSLFYSFIDNLDALENDKDKESLELIGIFESILYGYLCVQLAFVNDYLYNSSENELTAKLKKIDWNKRSSIYNSGFQFHLLKELEWLFSRISFEISVEGKPITPFWYQQSYIAYFEARKLKEDILDIVDFSNKRFDNLYDACKKKKYYWCCSALLSREFEYWNKISSNYIFLKKTWISLAGHYKIIDFEKIDLDFELIEKRIKEKESKLNIKIIEQCINLISYERSDTCPDYLGQFLHLTSYSTFNAICNNDSELLEKLFPKYFYASLEKMQNLHKKINLDGWTIQSRMNIARAPILDLLDISGYAKLMSDYYHEPKIWNLVKNTFDKYLRLSKDTKKTLEFIILCVQFADDSFALPFRHEVRFDWRRTINLNLDKLPYKEVIDNSFFRKEKIIEHDSYLVRWFASQDITSHPDGIDIFIYEYLSKRDEVCDIKFSIERNRFKEILEKEQAEDKEMNLGNNNEDVK
jgi:hypothetical protein